MEAKTLEKYVINPFYVLFKSPLKPRICFPFWSQDFTIKNPKLSRLRLNMDLDDVSGRLTLSRLLKAGSHEEMTLTEEAHERI